MRNPSRSFGEFSRLGGDGARELRCSLGGLTLLSLWFPINASSRGAHQHLVLIFERWYIQHTCVKVVFFFSFSCTSTPKLEPIPRPSVGSFFGLELQFVQDSQELLQFFSKREKRGAEVTTTCGDFLQVSAKLHALDLHNLLLAIDGLECVLSRRFIKLECAIEARMKSTVDGNVIIWRGSKGNFSEDLRQSEGKRSL